jgi:hypothetical protein
MCVLIHLRYMSGCVTGRKEAVSLKSALPEKKEEKLERPQGGGTCCRGEGFSLIMKSSEASSCHARLGMRCRPLLLQYVFILFQCSRSLLILYVFFFYLF